MASVMETDSIISLISDIRESANNLINEELSKRGVTDIVTSHGNILVQLFQHGPLPMNRIAALIKRKKNTVTVLIEKMKLSGYVTMNKSAEDSRVTMVELTEKGEGLQEIFKEISGILLDKVWSDIKASDRRQIVDGLQKISENFKKT
jgi:MarR family transcriptional regulator, organic hydroperoxide resistance regulator